LRLVPALKSRDEDSASHEADQRERYARAHDVLRA